MEVVDLTHAAGWRHYLACHAEARRIIGPGVVGFEGRFLDFLEPNKDKLNLPGRYGKQRFDFVVHRVGGTACRMHPGEKVDAKLVFGLVQDWRYGARAPTPGQATTPSMTGAVDIVHGHVDVYSTERTYCKIMDLFHERRGTPAELSVDLLTGDFPWNTFLMGRPWGMILLDERVTSMHLVCDSRGKPVIDVFTRERPDIRRRITFIGGRARLSESA